jgi:hypothetical protein
MLSNIPPEIWNMLESYMLDGNLIKFLVIYQSKCQLQLDIKKLEYRWYKRNPKILWQPVSLNYPNVRLGIPYIEFYHSDKSCHKKIEYLPETIVETVI